MTIKKTLESFDEKFMDIYYAYNRQKKMVDKNDIKDFIKESIIQSLKEITPERKEVDYDSISQYTSGGFNQAIDQLEKNKIKFLNN